MASATLAMKGLRNARRITKSSRRARKSNPNTPANTRPALMRRRKGAAAGAAGGLGARRLMKREANPTGPVELSAAVGGGSAYTTGGTGAGGFVGPMTASTGSTSSGWTSPESGAIFLGNVTARGGPSDGSPRWLSVASIGPSVFDGRLKTLSTLYEKYRGSFSVQFRSTVGTNIAAGVAAYCDADPTDLDTLDTEDSAIRYVTSQVGARASNINAGFITKLPGQSRELFTGDAPDGTAASARQTLAGVFRMLQTTDLTNYLGSTVDEDLVVGQVYLLYSVQFRIPQFSASGVSIPPSAVYQWNHQNDDGTIKTNFANGTTLVKFSLSPGQALAISGSGAETRYYSAGDASRRIELYETKKLGSGQIATNLVGYLINCDNIGAFYPAVTSDDPVIRGRQFLLPPKSHNRTFEIRIGGSGSGTWFTAFEFYVISSGGYVTAPELVNGTEIIKLAPGVYDSGFSGLVATQTRKAKPQDPLSLAIVSLSKICERLAIQDGVVEEDAEQ